LHHFLELLFGDERIDEFFNYAPVFLKKRKYDRIPFELRKQIEYNALRRKIKDNAIKFLLSANVPGPKIYNMNIC